MKKIIALLSLVAILATFYTFQSCTRELISNQPTVEDLLEDQDFRKFAQLHWELTSQLKFFRADITSKERGELLKRTQELGTKKQSSFDLDDSKEAISLLGFSSEIQLREFLTRYNTQYQLVKTKFTSGDNLSNADVQSIIFDAYSDYARGEGWKFKKDKRDKGGYVYSTRLVNVRDLTTVQLRSCTGDLDCSKKYSDAVKQARINLNNSITAGTLGAFGISAWGGPAAPEILAGLMLLVLANATANFALEINIADDAFEDCMDKKKNGIVNRSFILIKN
jgi:hypothetical protein